MTDNLTELKCSETFKKMLDKYKDNEYMTQRIYNHIVNYLPTTLENEFKNHEKRINRTNFLTNEQNIFIQVFLSKNKYFYLPTNNFFYEYDGKKYLIVKEDDVIHKLLSTISKDRVLLEWKYKTKTNIIKHIKDRSLFSSIPETDTIQNVLNVLYPTFFYSKNAAKYFLTIIGDNIFKKNSHIICLVSQKMKQFLNELDNVAFLSISNTNTTNNFMTKYHENHSYENCRIIKFNENFSNEVWRELLKKIGLDLLCVSAHFVWKQFLSSYNLPNIIYSNTLKNLFKEKYLYDENSDSFIGITSKYLPVHSDFIKFWENTITVSNNNLFYSELEIDEICSLFKYWTKHNSEQLLTNGNICEDNILNILKHFFSTVEISENKFVLNVTCCLWNKMEDINNSFDFIKQEISNNNKLALISFDDVYNYYYKFCNINSLKFIVSKRFFEKYLYFKLSEHIVYEKFIETEWLYETN